LYNLSSIDAQRLEIMDKLGSKWKDKIIVPQTTKELHVEMQTKQNKTFKINPLLGPGSSPILQSLLISNASFCTPSNVLAIIKIFPLL
jgi:hypothetical protein